MKDLTRRKFFRAGLGATGVLAASSSLARICGVATGRQSLGPFFPNEGTPEDPVREDPSPDVPIYLANDNDLTFVQGRNGRASGQVALVKGVVRDENCLPLPNATLVVWQASESGRYNHHGDSANEDFRHPRTGELIKRELDPHFQYWGRAQSDEKGVYHFKTIIPGFYPADLSNSWYRPPHIHFLVSAMGYPQLVTQMYFRGEEIAENDFIQELNEQDPLLQSRELTREQRENLLVDFREENGILTGRFDITLKR